LQGTRNMRLSPSFGDDSLEGEVVLVRVVTYLRQLTFVPRRIG
jgi:hypothetical protein